MHSALICLNLEKHLSFMMSLEKLHLLVIISTFISFELLGGYALFTTIRSLNNNLNNNNFFL